MLLTRWKDCIRFKFATDRRRSGKELRRGPDNVEALETRRYSGRKGPKCSS